MRPVRQGVFRAYDIRGRAGEDFDAEWVYALGRACGTYFRSRGRRCTVLGRDCRLTSAEYALAAGNGLLASGMDVVDLGMLPTPAFYFAAKSLRRQAGIMVTASHNPGHDNGFKIWSGDNTMPAEEIAGLYHIMRNGEFCAAKNAFICGHDIGPSYLDYLCANLNAGRDRRLSIVVDGGNGAGGPLCVELLRRLGAKVFPLNIRPDGNFPGHPPDPTIPENLAQLRSKVLEVGADAGFALDGDADRLVVIDEKGGIMPGDKLLAIYARELLADNPGALVLADVKCSRLLFEDVAGRGGRTVMTSCGHSPMKARMKALGAKLAGEITGHIIFADRYFGFDDAIYAAGRLVEILGGGQRPLSAMPGGWPDTFTTPEIRLPCPEKLKFRVIELAEEDLNGLAEMVTVDGLRLIFPDGWALLRASNTQPLLSMRFEADSKDRLQELRAMIEGRLEDWIKRAAADELSINES